MRLDDWARLQRWALSGFAVSKHSRLSPRWGFDRALFFRLMRLHFSREGLAGFWSRLATVEQQQSVTSHDTLGALFSLGSLVWQVKGARKLRAGGRRKQGHEFELRCVACALSALCASASVCLDRCLARVGVWILHVVHRSRRYLSITSLPFLLFSFPFGVVFLFLSKLLSIVYCLLPLSNVHVRRASTSMVPSSANPRSWILAAFSNASSFTLPKPNAPCS